MSKKNLFALVCLIGLVSFGQECPTIGYPQNGATEIPVDATITWPVVNGINGYLISLGSTPGGSEILDRRSIGQDNFYTAPTGLPENVLIYVSLSLVPFDAPPIECGSHTFTTVDVTTPPPCTILSGPDDNASNVTIISDLSWQYAPTATGYILSIGTAPGSTDILDNFNVGNTLIYDPPNDLPNNAQIYVTVRPINENGSMSACTEESFSTGGTAYDCDPIIDSETGETIFLRPEINFPTQIGLCSEQLPFTISTDDIADGFRWYKTVGGSEEILLSENNEVPISEPGRYRYEAYNILGESGGTIECANSKLFNVVLSGIATIESIIVDNIANRKRITVFISGAGDFEFALDNIEGPYQDSHIFENVSGGFHTVYVRDKNGCGIVQRTVDRDLVAEDFPYFFTPNGDGVNEFWQYIPPKQNFEIGLQTISIFDRFGSFLVQIDANSKGWDGHFRGRPLPSSDYWYQAVMTNGQKISGHFSLKR